MSVCLLGIVVHPMIDETLHHKSAGSLFGYDIVLFGVWSDTYLSPHASPGDWR